MKAFLGLGILAGCAAAVALGGTVTGMGTFPGNAAARAAALLVELITPAVLPTEPVAPEPLPTGVPTIGVPVLLCNILPPTTAGATSGELMLPAPAVAAAGLAALPLPLAPPAAAEPEANEDSGWCCS